MITDLQAEPIGQYAFRLTWSTTLSGSPTFYVYRDGVRVGVTLTAEWIVTVQPGESPVIEVFDDEADVPARAWPPYAVLSWRAVSGAESYRVEQLVGAAWATRRIAPATDARRYTWRSAVLADGETHQFRVSAIGADSNAAAAADFSLLMVRVPDVPDETIAYDGAVAGTVTIS